MRANRTAKHDHRSPSRGRPRDARDVIIVTRVRPVVNKWHKFPLHARRTPHLHLPASRDGQVRVVRAELHIPDFLLEVETVHKHLSM